MKAEYINPFVRAVGKAFETMVGCSVTRGSISLANAAHPTYEVNGIIGLSGRAIGTVVVSLSETVALKAASAMLMIEATEINADVVDAVGELTNMIAGAAKAELEEFQLSISLPTVIIGRNQEVRFRSDIHPICVPFQTEWGPLSIDVGLSEVAVPAGV